MSCFNSNIISSIHAQSFDSRYALGRDGDTIFIINTLSGEIIRTLQTDCHITKSQLTDPAALALVGNTLVTKATRAKRKVSNPQGAELMQYRMNDGDRYFMLLKAVVSTDPSLRAKSGKLNFNFRDLGRILCLDEFSSDHLFSNSRGNEYTMAAYKAVLDRFVAVCRAAWDGQNLEPEHNLDDSLEGDLA